MGALRRLWWGATMLLGAFLAACTGGGAKSDASASGNEDHGSRLRAPEGLSAAPASTAEDSMRVALGSAANAPTGETGGDLRPVIGTEMLRRELTAGRDVALLDVRSPGEYASGHIDGALNIPVNQLAGKLDQVRDFQHGRELVVYCEVGGRTKQAAKVLQAAGFEHVVLYLPGMREWRKQ